MSAMLKQAGHEVSFLDGIIADCSGAEVAEVVMDRRPDLVGITVNALQVNSTRQYTGEIKKRCAQTPIVVGGPLVSAVSKGIFGYIDNMDYAVAGEGEYAILDLVEHLQGNRDIGDVTNLLFRDGEHIRANRRERITDLDALPLPDYSIVHDYGGGYPGARPSMAQPSFHVMCTRGCPFKCRFCSSPVSWGSKVTYRKIANILEEVKMLVSQNGAKEIFFQDDTLNLKRVWFESLCDELIKSGLSKKVYFKAPFRANRNLIDKAILDKARAANFWLLFFGVESGNQSMLKDMNKSISVDEIKRAFQLTDEADIKPYASFILGFPNETHQTVKDSFDLVKDIKPSYGGFAVLDPFPGTGVYDEIVEQKLGNNLELSRYDPFRCNLRTHYLTNCDIVAYARQGDKLIHDMALLKEGKTATAINKPLPDNAFNVDISMEHTPEFFTRGMRSVMKVRIKNDSNTQWPCLPSFKGGHNVCISYHWFTVDGSSAIAWDNPRTPLPHDLKPGGEICADVLILAPREPGEYLLKIAMVQEHVAWFQEKGSRDISTIMKVL
jgi:radical SAM superfamily enzyme YgiQ (UPF0313 family)